jgi:hypothetical protein
MTERHSMKVFIFENLETGNFQPIVAPNESAARLRLGGLWTDVELTRVFRYCNDADSPSLIGDVFADEMAARQAATAANSIGKARITSTDDIARFSADQTRYTKLKTLRAQLSRIVAGL